jgi:hypothetical protein
VEYYFSLYKNSFRDLNERPQTLKLLKENMEKSLENIIIGDVIQNRTTSSQDSRERTKKWHCLKLKSFYTVKKIPE